MSLLFSKLRLQIPQVSDGKNAIITSPRGVNRSVPMTYPLTDVFVAGMDKYTVQAGVTTENFSVGNGKLKKIVTEDATALTVTTMPTKTQYIVGENLDLSGTVINANVQKGDGTSATPNVTALATYSPANGSQLNTQGTQTINIFYGDASTSFNVDVVTFILKKLPYSFYRGAAVIFNNEIHILGGYGNAKKHYKFNGSSWSSVSTLPYNFYDGAAVVINNEIHIIGSSYSSTTKKSHYKWDGTNWSSVSTLPDDFGNTSNADTAVVYNNAIHIFYGGYPANTMHYIWDGSSWTSASGLSYFALTMNAAIVFDNAIHLFGGNGGTEHKIWNGSSWSSGTALPTAYTDGQTVIYKGKLNVCCGYNKFHYEWNGSSWASVSTPPRQFRYGSGVAINDLLILLGGDSDPSNDAQWNGTSWTDGAS